MFGADPSLPGRRGERPTRTADQRALRLSGGAPGKPGKNELILPNGKRRPLASKAVFTAPKGSVLRIETPGGGGWGK